FGMDLERLARMIRGSECDIAPQTRTRHCVASTREKAMKHRRFFQGVTGAVLAAASLCPVWARDPVASIEDVRKLEEKIEAVAKKAMGATVALISEESGA